MQPRTLRSGRRPAQQPQTAFESFFERNALREKRQKSRRNMIIVSLLVHAVALLGLVFYSMWETDELWVPPVGVKMFSRSAAPAVPLPAPPPLPAPR
jgi:hypothetical protein